MSNKKIVLKPGKEEMIQRFHPWIFSGAISKMDTDIREGELIDVYNSKHTWVAKGHYQIGSIAVRILSFSDEKIDVDFWKSKIRKALDVRIAANLLRPENNAFRLIHGEGDGLPGLIVDVYEKTAVMQAHAVGMHIVRHELAKAVFEVLNGIVEHVFYKSESTLPFKADIPDANDCFLIGGNNETIAVENGLRFFADFQRGQKTGFFIDQRENRALLEHYASGRKVLNMFCYTGGFSFYAMRGGANLVHSVDSSSKAIDLTNKNIQINFGDDNRHTAFAIDAFKFLDNIKDKYDLIILDPPAFAKHRKVLNNALQGYRKLNAKAFEQILPGGILFTFSCSQAVSKEQFRLAVFSAAAQSKRNVRILHQLTQPADHPVNIYHPEGEYLKGLVLYVE